MKNDPTRPGRPPLAPARVRNVSLTLSLTEEERALLQAALQPDEKPTVGARRLLIAHLAFLGVLKILDAPSTFELKETRREVQNGG